MGKFCCVVGCGKRSERDENFKFFKVPSVVTHQGEQTRKISKQRRENWLANIRRDAVSNGEVKNRQMCSRHFHLGKPAKLYDKTHPDWAPSVAMGHSSCTVKQPSTGSALKRHQRSLNRSTRKQLCLDASENNKENLVESCSELEPQEMLCVSVYSDDKVENNFARTSQSVASVGTQTELIETLPDKSTSDQNVSDPLSYDSFKKDDEKVKFYTGLPSMSVLSAVLDLVSPGMAQRSSLSKFQQVLLILMRLRLNLPVQDLAYRFGVHASTVSRVFKSCIQVMYTSMKFLIHWPDREELRLTLPVSFREKFTSCAVIIDCFEIFIDCPSDLLARAQTWSSYKHHNTAKFLIGITPQGTVSFISKGWGGRTSDKFITEHCNLLQNLVPGDLVLADRGFDIQDSCGLYCASVKIPSFTRGKPQLSPLDIETTRSIANVRIHVERVIGCVRQKYTIYLGMELHPLIILGQTMVPHVVLIR